MTKNQKTDFNRIMREVLDRASVRGLTQQMVADAIGISRVALNRSASNERILGHEPLAKLVKVCALDEEWTRLLWGYWIHDILTRSRYGSAAMVFVQRTASLVDEREYFDLLLEAARGWIKESGGKPTF